MCDPEMLAHLGVILLVSGELIDHTWNLEEETCAVPGTEGPSSTVRRNAFIIIEFITSNKR